MDTAAPILNRSYSQINQNRRRLVMAAYSAYPEYVYCERDEFNWHTSEARTNLFDLYYLVDSGYIELIRSTLEGRRRPDFFILTPAGANLIEMPGKLDNIFPVTSEAHERHNSTKAP